MFLLLVILCLVNFIEFGTSQRGCAPEDKVCDNGQCIAFDNWCDGKVHCKDGSDETNKCLDVRCKKNSFRCQYGACIQENLKCDGKNDCEDGSDEIAFECLSIKKNGNCSEFEVQCQNLQCIPQDFACDTKIDCTDGSDETKKTCKTQHCRHYLFKCAYGACISSTKKCDNNIDCIDGSDEENCDDRIGGINSKLPIITQRVSEQITPINANYYSNNAGDTNCYVPRDDFLALIEDGTNLILRPGTNSSVATSITYICLKNTFIIGKETTNFCDGFSWVNDHPRCIKRCPPIINYTIKPVCELNGVGVPCNQPVRVGTKAKINCEDLYKKPNDRRVNEDLQCQDDGNWDYEPFKCEQTCGTIHSNVGFSLNSKITEVDKVPWNAGIYQKNINEKFEQICGGTLIRSKIIISAAHCFWNPTTQQLLDKSNYMVTVGKFYRDFYATNETQLIQKRTLSKIYIPTTFNGATYDFANDIAVLTLNEHVQFYYYVKPACITWKRQNEQYVSSGITGVVAGWGITNNNQLSPELRSLELESIDGQTCQRVKLKPTEKIANDKFCVETSEGKNVCKGDSGAGFLVAETLKNAKYYHLWGVVSNGIISKTNRTVLCNSDFITSFTNIQYYEYLVSEAVRDAYTTT